MYKAQEALQPSPDHLDELTTLADVLALLQQLDLSLDLWRNQNLFYERQQIMVTSPAIVDNQEWQTQIGRMRNVLGVAAV